MKIINSVPQAKDHLKRLFRAAPRAGGRRGFLRLDMNENAEGLPGVFIKKALKKIDRQALAKYPEYESLIGKIARHNNIPAGNVFLANGSDAAIKYIFEAFVRPKDRILLADPAFAMYPVYCAMFDARPVKVTYNPDLSFPFARFMDLLGSDIRVAVVVNPNNPTGTALSRGALLSIMRKAKKNNVIIVIDEAYYYFYPETVISHTKEFSNLIVLRTFSKLCGLAGLRLGYACAHPQVVEALNKAKPSFEVNIAAVTMAEAILDSPQVIRAVVREAYEGRDYLTGRLRQNSIVYKCGQANFILIKCGGRALEIQNRLAKKKILVAAGFRQDFLKDYIRVTLGTKGSMRRFWEAFEAGWR